MAVKKSSSKKSSKKATTKTTTIHADSCSSCGNCKSWGKKNSGSFYFMGFVGALIYYMSIATGFWSVVIGIIQAIIWPAMLVLHVLGL